MCASPMTSRAGPISVGRRPISTGREADLDGAGGRSRRGRRPISTGPEADLDEKSGEQEYDRLGDAGGLVLALDLDREAHRELVPGGHLDDLVDLGGGP